MKTTNIRFKDNDHYLETCLQICRDRLSGYKDIQAIESDEEEINKYAHLDCLSEPKNVYILDEISRQAIDRAKQSVLAGKFFAEHAAAGEATRLKLGTKYLIDLSSRLSPEEIAERITEEKNKDRAPEEKKIFISAEDVLKEAGCRPGDLFQMTLGARHMLQYSFDIHGLAQEMGEDPQAVLSRQKMIIILNEKTADEILKTFAKHGFYGFARENVMFMIQKSFSGIDMNGQGDFFYDEKSEKRLHNHGQMVMQQTMDDEVFFQDAQEKRRYLKSAEFGDILKTMDDKQSFNIEDLAFLTSAIDFESLAMALSMKDEGYKMVMEIVANNKHNPQKGGMAAYDEKLSRNVMIESFQLKGIEDKDIHYLNKNFNHYPDPYECWHQLKLQGLNMPLCEKDGKLYFQPVQGDINFLVKTQFVQRKVLKSIKSWKSSATTPLAIRYLKMQDEQEGFEDYARRFVGSVK